MSNQKGYTKIKNGLWSKKHADRLGAAWILFGKYLSYINAPMSKPEKVKNEVCVFIYPKSIQKQLDIDAETWRSYHQNLVNEGYVESHMDANSDAVCVCIKKAIF